MTTLRLVELNNGRFAIQKRLNPFAWEFVDHEGYAWDTIATIEKYCLVNTLPQAEERMTQIIAILGKRHILVKKVHKVVKC